MGTNFKSNDGFTVHAHVGDAKTLLAFDITKAARRNKLAGFTIWCEPAGQEGYYLLNTLQFEKPACHAQDSSLPPTSSVNAPFHKFRWVHIPGSVHQGLEPVYGRYTYVVTPRYFNAKREMLPLDESMGVSVSVDVGPFKQGALALGFTRGFTQSEAFAHRFGKDASIAPNKRSLIFDTNGQSGKNARGEVFTYLEEYTWSGFTARKQIFGLLDMVDKDKSLSMDVFAYDLNEPDLCARFLKLAAAGRLRMVLDDASLHHTKKGKKVKGKSKPVTLEDAFEREFNRVKKGGSAILRGHFGRYAHDKVLIVSKGIKPDKKVAKVVLTGSTNMSVTGMYVNSNHVLVFEDAKVAGTYLDLFNEVISDEDEAIKKAYVKTEFAQRSFSFKSANVPKMSITFAPHSAAYTMEILEGVSDRIAQETKKRGSVLFAVMQVDGSDSTVYNALSTIHKNEAVYSYGITDTVKGIALYKSGQRGGVLVTGKPASTVLPPPFDQVRNIGGIGHQVHHKFVVCGLRGSDPVVYCGSSNLASGGEKNNGDNLLEIHDAAVAMVFAIEALTLVDHFDFLDKYATKKSGKGEKAKLSAAKKAKPVSKTQAAASARWFLSTDNKWTNSYFSQGDLHYKDRRLFA